MKTMTLKRIILLTALLAVTLSAVTGGTIAWFTDEVSSANNVITSGNLDMIVEYKNGVEDNWKSLTKETKLFKEDARYEPGYTETVFLRVANAGDLSFKYRLALSVDDIDIGQNVQGNDIKLSDYLEVGIYRLDEYNGVFNYADILLPSMFSTREDALKNVTSMTKLNTQDNMGLITLANDCPVLAGDKTAQVIALVLTMPTTVGNEANHNGNAPKIDLGLNIVATQFIDEKDSFGKDYDKDAEYPTIGADTWDGQVDTSWYDPENPQTEYVITTSEQVAGLAELVNKGNTFAGKTIKLGKNIDLYCEDTTPAADGDPLTFRPIGDHSKGGTFEGTFDGNGYTISNLYQNGWDLGYEWGKYGSYGLFGKVNNATIKNLTLSGGESYIEGGDVSFVAGSATGTCVFENITIKDSVAATYNNGCGGIIGWSGAGNYTFKNITIEEDAVLAGLWGSFDSSIGGIVGQAEPGATYNFDNVNIECRIDAYNDCTASYDYYNYRMCGMIIGRLEETTTIDGANYPDTSKYNITCNNVKVTYGDWANYHYCEPTPGLNGGRGMRVEPGYAYDGLPADYDHSQCVDNHMNLIPFDQIFGGDQIAVKGLKTYAGVNVIYNNK